MNERSDDMCGGMIWGVVVSVVVLVFTSLFFQSRPPAPGEAERRQIRQTAAKPEGDANKNDKSPQSATATTAKIIEPEGGPHENSTTSHENDPAFGKFWEAIASPVTYFTFVLMAVAILQWCLARQQARDTRTRQRAWVVVEGMDGTLKTNQALPSHMVVFNSSETPTFIDRRIIEAFVLPRDTLDLSVEVDAVARNLEASDKIAMILAPNGQKHTFNKTHESLIVNDELMGRIAHDGGNDTIFLVGIVRYRDTLDAEHTSVCCYRWNADPSKKKWIGHPRNNKMT